FAPPRPIPTRPPRTPTLFPYTTLFRSVHRQPASPPTEVRRLGQRIDRVGQRNVGQRGRVRRGHRAHRATGAECHRHPLPRPHGHRRRRVCRGRCPDRGDSDAGDVVVDGPPDPVPPGTSSGRIHTRHRIHTRR